MAWVRRVRTASGATAVQIARSVAGRREIVCHVGSAHDEAELGMLLALAWRMLDNDAQPELDLGMSPPDAAKVALLAGPATALVEDPSASSSSRPEMVAGPRVLGTCSGLLYLALAGSIRGSGSTPWPMRRSGIW